MRLHTKFKSYDRMVRPIRFATRNSEIWTWLKALDGTESNPETCAFFLDDTIDHLEFDRADDEITYKLKFGHLK